MSAEWLCLFGPKKRRRNWLLQQGVYIQLSDRQPDDSFEGGKTVPHENVYVRKINLQETLEVTEISYDNFLNARKSCSLNSKKRSHCHLFLRIMQERL